MSLPARPRVRRSRNGPPPIAEIEVIEHRIAVADRPGWHEDRAWDGWHRVIDPAGAEAYIAERDRREAAKRRGVA